MGKLASHKALAGRRTKRSVGAYGAKRNTQAKSAKQVTKKNNRLQDGRVKAALAEARAAEAIVETLVQEERPGPALGAQYGALSKWAAGKLDSISSPSTVWQGKQLVKGVPCETCGLGFAACAEKVRDKGRPCCRLCGENEGANHHPENVKRTHAFEPYEGDGKCETSIRDARTLIRQGYHASAAMRRTGVGFRWIEDMVGQDGYMKASLA